MFRLELDSQPQLRLCKYLPITIKKNTWPPSPSCDIKGLECARNRKAPPDGDGNPSCVLLMLRLLACVLIVSWSIHLTNSRGQVAQSVCPHRLLAYAYFLTSAYFYLRVANVCETEMPLHYSGHSLPLPALNLLTPNYSAFSLTTCFLSLSHQ